MTQEQKRKFLIKELLNEHREYDGVAIPEMVSEQKKMLRILMNIRMPGKISPDFLKVQDDYLQEVNREKGHVTLADMDEIQKDLYIWQGDITRLAVGAIVNAANSGMTGCYQPCHNCIDNCIHTFAGIQLRNYCQDMMVKQGYEEPTGQAKITPAYNLPSDYVIHTVGPIVQGALTEDHEKRLASCYRSCLEAADAVGAESLAFCCISTGLFMFPNRRAAEIAVSTVRQYKATTQSKIKVIFNVFKDEDDRIYRQLLR
ncbi:MAG: protein-ADP-ribose hydrolase [Lachnospiraceae bacterium]|nr:protein-ADP-ribose hydrolase [Lachnospiraceae bacterium]